MNAANLARGRWADLLASFGIDRNLLSGRHTPCPACGGKDRFRFDDQEGRGTYFCSHCGSGDGFALLGLVNGWTFKQAADAVERIVGAIPVTVTKPLPSATDKLDQCQRIWHASNNVVVGDPVHEYLLRRTGLSEIPSCLRFHPDLVYRHDDGSLTRHPAMVARVTGPDGDGVAIHRTYLTTGGAKANVPTVKKVVGSLPASSAVRLFAAGRTLGIAEGIESALSASWLFRVPAWAAISAGGLDRWTPPACTNRVIVFGDNDVNGVGQAAAWNLAKRLIASGIKTEVRIPQIPNTDWNDFAQSKKEKKP